jgi:hypothetical protein
VAASRSRFVAGGLAGVKKYRGATGQGNDSRDANGSREN